MDSQEQGPETVPETPAKPKKPRMVTVYNASMRGQKFTLKSGTVIKPGQTAKIPAGVWEKVKHISWLQRAERGDVVK